MGADSLNYTIGYFFIAMSIVSFIVIVLSIKSGKMFFYKQGWRDPPPAYHILKGQSSKLFLKKKENPKLFKFLIYFYFLVGIILLILGILLINDFILLSG